MGLQDLFKSNFARIAENTTKYYLELKTNYGDKFSGEASLLATAGVLDTQNYVFTEHSIGLDTLIDMAKKAVSQKGEELTDYRRLKAQEFFTRPGGFREAFIRLSAEKEFEQDPLFNFVFSLEVVLFKVDNPKFLISDIEFACFKKASTIANTIWKTKEKYRDGGLFVSVTSSFMNSPDFQTYRKQLGIID
jgi:hypothetical protein